MIKFINYLNNLGTGSSKLEQSNQRIRFSNTVALLHLVFLSLILILLVYQYGFKAAAKLVLISSLIPIITLTLNRLGRTLISRYWISYTLPFFIMLISIFTKWNNEANATGFYEFFDTRMLVFVSALIPLLIFSRKNPLFLLIALLPSATFLFGYDLIHNLFNVGYTDLFEDPKGGYYIAGLMFDASYLFAVVGILSLKKSNEELVNNNSILINDLNNKNAIQEKLLLRKQELLAQNSKVHNDLLIKQEELLKSKNELERASELINYQKNELQFKNMELTNLVDEKTRELKKANKELLVQNNGLLQFSNTVSHNLRAPVASLLGLVNLFALEPDSKRKEEMIPHIKNSSEALDTIIGDLNKVVDIRNQLYYLKENINLGEEIEKIKKLLQVGYKGSNVLIETDLKIDSIYFIRSYMHSILLNLINNAVKYSNLEQKSIIQIKSWQKENSIFIEVKDNGLGIDLVRFGNNLFKMYKRFHIHVGGKGLGLYLVKQQVEAMNGKITVESELEKGTIFQMKFPIPKKVHFQKYFNSSNATIAYDARLMASILIWHKSPDSKDYKEILSANKEMFANYNAVKWVVDVRNLGLISKEDREWFVLSTLPEIAKRGCKTMILIKNSKDSKDFAYWQRMLDVMDNMGVVFKVFYDYDLAIEFLQNKQHN